LLLYGYTFNTFTAMDSSSSAKRSRVDKKEGKAIADVKKEAFVYCCSHTACRNEERNRITKGDYGQGCRVQHADKRWCVCSLHPCDGSSVIDNGSQEIHLLSVHHEDINTRRVNLERLGQFDAVIDREAKAVASATTAGQRVKELETLVAEEKQRANDAEKSSLEHETAHTLRHSTESSRIAEAKLLANYIAGGVEEVARRDIDADPAAKAAIIFPSLHMGYTHADFVESHTKPSITPDDASDGDSSCIVLQTCRNSCYYKYYCRQSRPSRTQPFLCDNHCTLLFFFQSILGMELWRTTKSNH
jgi:hypothetical protein